MKFVALGLVGCSIVLTASVAVAGESNPQGALLLLGNPSTPGSIEANTDSNPTSPYSPEQLSTVSESLQVRPTQPPTNSPAPTNGASDNSVHTASTPTVNPIDFFQVPPLDFGIKVNLSQN
jgi:hypothetical protein